MWNNLIKTKIAYAQTAESIIGGIKREIISPLIYFFMAAATIVFIWGVIEMIMAADNEDARTTGKRHIAYGLIGLFIMVAAGAIIEMVCLFWGRGALCG